MTIRMPDISISLVSAAQRVQNEEQKVLFIGQMTTGTASPGFLYSSIGNNNEQDSLFGKKSMLATMIRAAKYHNKISRFDAIPLVNTPSLLTYTRSFASLVGGFIYNPVYTESNGSRTQQKDQGGGSYVGDIIIPPISLQPYVYSYATFTATDDGTIRYTLDGQYWNGSAWAVSDNTWAKSSTATDISAHITTLIPTGVNIAVKVFTNTGAVQQWVSNLVITFHDIADDTAAVRTIVFSGSVATESGTISVSVGSKSTNTLLGHTYPLAVTSGVSTPATLAVALAAAVNADTTAPMTATVSSGSVILTAVNQGVEGNNIGIAMYGDVAGISYIINLTTDGSGFSPVDLSIVGETRYQTIVFPYYLWNAVKTFLDARFNVDKKIQDGVGITCMTETSANLINFGASNNSQSMVLQGNKGHYWQYYYYGGSILELDYVISSQIAAIRALRLTTDTNIARYVSAVYGAKDAFGGMHIASLPYFNTILPSLPLEDNDLSFTDSEITSLAAAGVSVVGNNISNTNVIMGSTLTTYKTDGGGNPDVSFKYLEYVDTEVTCREYMFNNLRTRFSQCRLTNGDAKIGYNMANPQIISAYITGLYSDLASLALVQIGKDQDTGVDWLTYFKNNLTVVLDIANGKATVTMKLPIVTQLRTIIATMQVSFSSNE